MSVSRPTLLISRILQLRDASPLLILTDSISQSAWPLLQHFGGNARAAKLRVVTIGWRQESNVCTIDVSGKGMPKMKDLQVIMQEIEGLLSAQAKQKTVLLIPDLNDFLALDAAHLSTFLSSLIGLSPGTISITAVFHKDIPTPSYPSHLPTPTTLLQYLATSIIHVEPLTHVLLQKEAERQSKTSSVVLDLEGKDIFVPLGVNCARLVLSLEHRRKSGRGILETSVFDSTTGKIMTTAEVPGMDDVKDIVQQAGIPDEQDIGFKISLSDKEKSDRDGLILPHYVQIDDGRGGSVTTTTEQTRRNGAAGIGNIYYEPDSGDDFDLEDPDDDLML